MDTGITIVRPTRARSGRLEIAGQEWDGSRREWAFEIGADDMHALGIVIDQYACHLAEEHARMGPGAPVLMAYTWVSDDPRYGRELMHTLSLGEFAAADDHYPIDVVRIAPPGWAGDHVPEWQRDPTLWDQVVEFGCEYGEIEELGRALCNFAMPARGAQRVRLPARVISRWHPPIPDGTGPRLHVVA